MNIQRGPFTYNVSGFLAFSLCSLILAATFAIVPTRAFADQTISAQTAAIAPSTGTCPQISATSYQGYVYDGALDSFDVTISNPAYVAVAATAGNLNIPFNQITRRLNSDGSLRLHVDISSTPISQATPITVTMLSSVGGGAPVCVAKTTVGVSATSTGYETIAQSSTTVSQQGKSPVGQVSAAAAQKSEAAPQKTLTGYVQNLNISFGSITGAVTRVKDTVQASACGKAGNSSHLWFIFLVLYMLSLGAISLSRPPSNEPRSMAWIVSALVVPLLLLAAFWYVSAVCGVGRWVPTLAVIVGLFGLIVALRGDTENSQTLLLTQSDAKEVPRETTNIVTAQPSVPMVPVVDTTTSANKGAVRIEDVVAENTAVPTEEGSDIEDLESAAAEYDEEVATTLPLGGKIPRD